MVRRIVKDKTFLSLVSSPFEKEDAYIIQDLSDTLSSLSGLALGIAANMIGYSKRAIAVFIEGEVKVLLNPEIISCQGEYEAEEGCLSLDGRRKTLRYREIDCIYFKERMRQKVGHFSGLEAETIQHEIDHLNGILI